MLKVLKDLIIIQHNGTFQNYIEYSMNYYINGSKVKVLVKQNGYFHSIMMVIILSCFYTC